MNLFNRFFGIFMSPQQTQKMLAERPKWVDALILLLILFALFSYFIMPYSQKDTYDLMKDNIKLRERMGDERFDAYLEKMQTPNETTALLQPFLIGPVTLLIGFCIQSLILLGMGKLAAADGKFKQVFSVFLHGRFIDLGLGGALKLFLVLTKKSFMQTSTSLAMFFPKLTVTSPAFIVLSQFDFFQIWAYGVIGIGLAAVFKIDLKKGLIFAYLMWLIKSLLYIALGLLSRSLLT
ncbi:MAG: YIP1 family protein [Acidobacteria bacterium]|nr:YIP1 family protein [Acidobacteriota bacterium]